MSFGFHWVIDMISLLGERGGSNQQSYLGFTMLPRHFIWLSTFVYLHLYLMNIRVKIPFHKNQFAVRQQELPVMPGKDPLAIFHILSTIHPLFYRRYLHHRILSYKINPEFQPHFF